MIVVAIVAILAAIATPSYSDYLKRGRIAEAVGNLADMRVKLEQFYQDNRTYAGACVAGTVAPRPADTAYFAFTCPTLGAAAYQVQASGQGVMNGFVYVLEQDGAKRTTGLPVGWSGASATSTCWVLTKGGAC